MDLTLFIKILLAVIFTLSVAAKLTGKTKSTFKDAGYSSLLMYTIAIVEIVFTVGLFTRYESLSTVVLLLIVGGAVFTLFLQKVKPAKYIFAIIAGLLLITLLVL